MMPRVGQVALAIVLTLVSAALGILAVNQVYEATRLLAALIPMSPDEARAWQRLVVTIPRIVLIVLGIGWLGTVMVWQHRYLRLSEEPARLWRVFVRTAVVELAVAGLASLVAYGVPGV